MPGKAGTRKRKAARSSRKGLWFTLGAAGVLIAIALLSLGVLPSPLAERAKAGPPAPDFTVPTLDGGSFTLSEHRGKPIILFAMAYWCGTCVPEARALGRIRQEYGDRVTIVALDVDPSSTPDLLRRFRQFAGNPGYIWAFDKNGRVTQAYRIRSLDTTIIIDAEVASSTGRSTRRRTRS